MKDVIKKYEAILKATKDEGLRQTLIDKIATLKEQKEVLK